MRYLIIILSLLTTACISEKALKQNGGSSGLPSEIKFHSQSETNLVLRKAPDFTATAVMADNRFDKITMSSYRGGYVVLFFYPLDFTFVCPTEILAFDKKLDKFKKHNCEVLGISIDSEYTHLAWKNTEVENGGIGKIRFPLISDITKNISRAYGVLHEDSIALRGLFIIDTEGIVRHCLVNDLSMGRNVDEALRTVLAAQKVDKYGELCPADWQPEEN